jgi:hypothetical protein
MNSTPETRPSLPAHPRLDQADCHPRVRLSEILRNDPPSARQAVYRIRLHPANTRTGQRPARFDEFNARFYVLETLNAPQEVGRDQLVAAYQQLIGQFPDHPGCADAMFAIAIAWEWADPSIKMESNNVQAIEWLRKSVAAARPGTPIWFRARSFLAGRIRWNSVDEARKILKEILAANPGPVDEVHAWRELESLALSQERGEEAEKICRRLLDQADRKDKQPCDMWQLREYRGEIRESARMLLDYWDGHAHFADGQTKIDSLLRDYHSPFLEGWIEQRAKKHGWGPIDWETQKALEAHLRQRMSAP